MGSITWGTGTDIFAAEYLDAQVPETGNNAYHSSDFSSHMLSAFELKRMSSHYEAGISTSTDDVTPQNAPLSLKQEGVTPGYYRTFHYRSHPAEDYFFSQNILMYDRHIITNVSDIQRLVWKPTINQYTRTNVTMVDGSTATFSYYQISQFEPSKMSILKKGSTTEYTAAGIDIVPAIISPDTANALQCFNYWDRNIEEGNFVDRVYRRYNQTYGTGSDNVARYAPTFNNGDDIILPNAASLTSLWAFDDTNNYVMRLYYKAADQYSYLWTSTCEVKYWVKTDDELCHVLARSGLKFEFNGVIYKPIAENGVITGYTDDMDQRSDWDNWHDYNDHEVPVTPPGPAPSGGDEDNDDPVNTTGAPFAAGLCHYYALTAGSVLLEHISEALGTWDIENTHKDLYKNLVSCKLVKPPAAIPTTGSEAFTIYGVKPQYEGADITLPVVSGNPDASFGPYSIDRKFGDFRDYAPYTRVSIYLPYCGWCDLPSHVVGRQVSVHYYTDIIAATCKAVVFCLSGTGSNIVAEAAGVIGLDIPFVADNVGAKMQAVTAGMIAALGGGIQLGAGIGTMVSTRSGSGAKSALSGASQYLSGYSQMAMAFNENTTEISGKNGDGCCLAGATNIIIKIVRPKKGAYTDAPYVPPGYGHNIGFVSQKQVKVSSVSGLLIADNVDTSGISGATEAERAEIKRVLESGLIVNTAPNNP